MPRYRQPERRWIHAACIAGAYLVLVAGLFTLQLGVGLSLPVSVAVAAPPLVYAGLAMLLLREAMFVRRLTWVGSACVIHLALATLAAIELTLGGGLSFGAALAHVFVLFPPAPVLTLVATPLTLAAFGLTASTPTRRTEASPRPAAASAPARLKPLSPGMRKNVSEATVPAAPALRGAPPPASTAATPAAPAARPPVSTTSVAPASVVAVPSAPAPVMAATAAAPAATWPPKPARRADEMVRVSFARIAAQLPAEAFVLPFERLSESLREPHVLLVPRRVVLSQMRDGAVAISWGHIASQFPDLALGMSDDEFRNQYPDLKLWLPMDEVASQLPRPELPRSELPRPEPAPVEPAPAPVTPATNGPTTVLVPPAPASAPRTLSVPTPASAPVLPSVPAPTPAQLVARDDVSRIVDCFSGVGNFESAAERVAGSTVVSLVDPSVPRDAVTACAGHLLRCLAGASAEIVTVRTRRAIIVLAVAPTPIVVAARVPGAPVALLGIRALRAAAGVVGGTLSLPSPPRRALEPVGVDGRMTQAARALCSFGAVEPTVFADGAARVYVFSAGGGDDKALGTLALNVCDALGDGGDLGRPRAVIFRRASEHTLVRPLAGGAGVLVAAGAVTRPGRLLGEADRAATVLEAM